MCLYAIIHIQFTNKYMYMYLECMLIFTDLIRLQAPRRKGFSSVLFIDVSQKSRPRFGRLPPTGQIQPAYCFYLFYT